MLDLVLLFGFAVAVLALALAWLRWKQTRVITPTAGFLVCSIFFVQIGFIYFYYEYDGVESARTALLNTSVGVLSVAVSIMLGLSWIERRSKVYRISHLPAGYPLSVYIAVACVLIALTLVYFLLIGYVPLIAAFYSLLTEGWSQGLLNRLRVSRDIYVNPQANYVPLQGFFEIIRYVGMVIIFMWAIHLRRIGFNRFLSGMLLASAFLLPVFAGQRWPLLHLLMSALIFLSYTLKTRQFLRILRVLTIIGFALGVLLTVLLARYTSPSGKTSEIFLLGVVTLMERLVAGNAVAPVLSFGLFPSRHPFLYGESYLQNLYSYLPGPAPSFPVTFYQIVTGDSIGFTAPPDFYTEAYINFGFLGTCIISFIFGISLVFLEVVLYQYRNNLFQLSVVCSFTLYISLSSSTGITFVLGWLITVLFVYLLFVALKILLYAKPYAHKRVLPHRTEHPALIIE
jgi:oligosaccharide repeat unit polymerase